MEKEHDFDQTMSKEKEELDQITIDKDVSERGFSQDTLEDEDSFLEDEFLRQKCLAFEEFVRADALRRFRLRKWGLNSPSSKESINHDFDQTMSKEKELDQITIEKDVSESGFSQYTLEDKATFLDNESPREKWVSVKHLVRADALRRLRLRNWGLISPSSEESITYDHRGQPVKIISLSDWIASVGGADKDTKIEEERKKEKIRKLKEEEKKEEIRKLEEINSRRLKKVTSPIEPEEFEEVDKIEAHESVEDISKIIADGIKKIVQKIKYVSNIEVKDEITDILRKGIKTVFRQSTEESDDIEIEKHISDIILDDVQKIVKVKKQKELKDEEGKALPKKEKDVSFKKMFEVSEDVAKSVMQKTAKDISLEDVEKEKLIKKEKISTVDREAEDISLEDVEKEKPIKKKKIPTVDREAEDEKVIDRKKKKMIKKEKKDGEIDKEISQEEIIETEILISKDISEIPERIEKNKMDESKLEKTDDVSDKKLGIKKVIKKKKDESDVDKETMIVTDDIEKVLKKTKTDEEITKEESKTEIVDIEGKKDVYIIDKEKIPSKEEEKKEKEKVEEEKEEEEKEEEEAEEKEEKKVKKQFEIEAGEILDYLKTSIKKKEMSEMEEEISKIVLHGVKSIIKQLRPFHEKDLEKEIAQTLQQLLSFMTDQKLIALLEENKIVATFKDGKLTSLIRKDEFDALKGKDFDVIFDEGEFFELIKKVKLVDVLTERNIAAVLQKDELIALLKKNEVGSALQESEMEAFIKHGDIKAFHKFKYLSHLKESVETLIALEFEEDEDVKKLIITRQFFRNQM